MADSLLDPTGNITVKVQFLEPGPPGANGTNGQDGVKGNDGWSPAYANVADGNRVVQKLVAFYGGEGAPPPVPENTYLGPTGFVTDIAQATNIRGIQGEPGPLNVAFEPVSSYAEMIAQTPDKTTQFKVAVDEDKGMENTIYQKWPDGSVIWVAALAQ